MTADEGALAREVAWKLGLDPGDRGRLADLAAVGIARLASPSPERSGICSLRSFRRRSGPGMPLVPKATPSGYWRR